MLKLVFANSFLQDFHLRFANEPRPWKNEGTLNLQRWAGAKQDGKIIVRKSWPFRHEVGIHVDAYKSSCDRLKLEDRRG